MLSSPLDAWTSSFTVASAGTAVGALLASAATGFSFTTELLVSVAVPQATIINNTSTAIIATTKFRLM